MRLLAFATSLLIHFALAVGISRQSLSMIHAALVPTSQAVEFIVYDKPVATSPTALSKAKPMNTPPIDQPQTTNHDAKPIKRKIKEQVKDKSAVVVSDKNQSDKNAQQQTQKTTIADNRDESTSPAISDSFSAEASDKAIVAKNEQEIYLSELQDLLRQNRRYPVMAKKLRQEGRVVVEFTMHEDGRVVNVKVVQGTSFQLLNQAALSFVKEIETFKPFPKSVARKTWSFSVPIEYRL